MPMTREQPGAEVGQRQPAFTGGPPGSPVIDMIPDDALRDEIETAFGAIGACLAVPGDRCVDESRVRRRQRVVAQAEPSITPGR